MHATILRTGVGPRKSPPERVLPVRRQQRLAVILRPEPS
jgi:hypothetical protein